MVFVAFDDSFCHVQPGISGSTPYILSGKADSGSTPYILCGVCDTRAAVCRKVPIFADTSTQMVEFLLSLYCPPHSL